MPLLETRGAASVQGFGALAASARNYIEDVFSTYLYTGNGSTQTITNGIDLAGKGGLVWIKSRSDTEWHNLRDTIQSRNLASNDTGTGFTGSGTISSFDSTGFSLGSYVGTNGSSRNFASWTFREQAKFFDVVTYTGNGVAGRTVAHNLGSVPGMIVVKAYSGGSSATANWLVYHRSLGATKHLSLNTTGSETTSGVGWNNTEPTSSVFSVGTSVATNENGTLYVAYLFAHDAGGFGQSGSDNVISCGSFTTGIGGKISAPVNLGYEVQWLLVKNIGASENWQIYDVMRGMPVSDGNSVLYPNLSNAEYFGPTSSLAPTATGFDTPTASGPFANSSTYIYIAIRRGPMKTPTTGTSVFSPLTATGVDGGQSSVTLSPGFVADLTMGMQRQTTGNKIFVDRLRGWPTGSNTVKLAPYSTLNEAGFGTSLVHTVAQSSGSALDYVLTATGQSPAATYINYLFRRAPGFFDEVCYTGDGTTTQTITHNLTVKPDLVIIKSRSQGTLVEAVANWYVWGMVSASSAVTSTAVSSSPFAINATTSGFVSTTSSIVNAANATTFKPHDLMGGNAVSNNNGQTYVAYLFATCPGVSKVGSYTGTGNVLQIDCGFTGGARFVLIKRTDSTGDWYVWDSARGIVSGNDPYLLLNSTAAEVTSTDYVDTYSAGFEISSTAPAAINANGGSFIFLAIA